MEQAGSAGEESKRPSSGGRGLWHHNDPRRLSHDVVVEIEPSGELTGHGGASGDFLGGPRVLAQGHHRCESFNQENRQ